MRSTTVSDWVTLAALAGVAYLAYANWGSLKSIGSSVNTKVSGALDSIAAAAKE